MVIRSVFVGCGAYAPDRSLSNHDLTAFFDTSDQWIRERTGILSRRIVGHGELTSSMAIHSARAAIESAGISPDDIGMIIMATATPDKTMPATAVYVQDALNLRNAFAFDIQSACAGFLYALSVADSFIVSGKVKNVLVIGAEAMSRIVDWSDRSTAVLFGDGGGATVLAGHDYDDTTGKYEGRGILAAKLYSDGGLSGILCTSGGVSSTQDAGFLTMSGQEVFRHAVRNLCSAAYSVLEEAGITAVDIDWVVPHQANGRIISAVMDRLKVPADKAIITIGDHANTSSASIPMALDYGVSMNKIKEGDLVLLLALGAGLSWGSVLLRW